MSNYNHQRALPRVFLVVLLPLLLSTAPASPEIQFQLKNGDRISGQVVATATNELVISNAWAASISLPLSTILKCETNSAAVTTVSAQPATKTNEVRSPKTADAAARNSTASKPRAVDSFQGQVQFGVNALFHTRQQQSYSGILKLTYLEPYESDPKKHIRNVTELRGDYQRTDGEQSANRARGGNKTDLDVWKDLYAYSLGEAGYDQMKKIDFQYLLGPGLGQHVLKRESFLVNVEGGLTYEGQRRRDAEDIESMSLRFGLNSVWQINKRVKLTQYLAFYPGLTEDAGFSNEFNSNLSYGLWKDISLNLSLLDEYESNVAPGVSPNRFEIRSSIGYTF